MNSKITIIAILTLVLTSCFKKDEMIPAHEPGEVTTVVIPMTRYYTYQVYFDLESSEIVSSNDRSIFDLNFDSNDTSTIIKLNTANFAMVAETEFEKLEDVTDTIGLTWKFDKSDGNPDSIAIQNWINIENNDTTYSNKIWIINRGVSSLGINLGLKKIQFVDLVEGKYYFTYSNMDNSGKVTASVAKDNLYSYVQFSFTQEEVVQTEPEVSDWNLLFTQYTTLLYTNEGLPYPYLVTGVLNSFVNTNIALDTTLNFEDIFLSDTSKFEFSTVLDKIGYDWKELVGDVNTGDIYYEIKLNYNYILRVNNLYYYKLRFTNFYDPESGEKGFPTFEYQKL